MQFSSKPIYFGKKMIKIAIFLVVSIFNNHFTSVLKIMEVIDITIGNTAYNMTVHGQSLA